MRSREEMKSEIVQLAIKVAVLSQQLKIYRETLERIRDCDWVITLPDRMDAVRAIAREALEN